MYSRLYVFGIAALLSSCAVGPAYKRPDMAVPAHFKESVQPEPIAGWKSAEPRAASDARWWTLYGDDELNNLLEQVNSDNQDIRIAEARYRQARSVARSARSQFLPTLGANVSVTRGSTNFSTARNSTINNSSAGGIDTERSAALDASWEIDLWGRVRRAVESGNASARASADDLAAARLSAQAELAINYFQLRALDARQQLFDRTVAAYEKSLQMTRNRYTAGVVSRADVVQAETQFHSARTDALDNRTQRAQLEHAIAILLGKAPAEFALTPRPLADDAVALAEQKLPTIPPALPSELLERRPDIAGAEQRVIAANADIGVAQAAYFPTLTLDATGGYRSSSAGDWLTVPNRFWSVGPSLLATLFDGGKRSAEKDRTVAAYDETVATYKQTVLTAFQEVEDSLIALQMLQQQAQSQDAAVQSARTSVEILTNQYKAGKVAYIDVINVQTIAFSNERAALQILGQRYTASVQLIKALGGDWGIDSNYNE